LADFGGSTLGSMFVTKTPRAEGFPRRTFPFDASAQVTVGNSDPVDARVREFSLYGCFLKFSILLVPGTPVFVKIFSESEIFEASGTVIYFSTTLVLVSAFGT
jgi:hypothetical protein